MAGRRHRALQPKDSEDFRTETEETLDQIQKRYLEREIGWRAELIKTYQTEKSFLQDELDRLSAPTKDVKNIPKSPRKNSAKATKSDTDV